jgi:hypothetical protein
MEIIAMQVQTEKRLYTPEEYLALEENAEYKSEYHDAVLALILQDVSASLKMQGFQMRIFGLRFSV